MKNEVYNMDCMDYMKGLEDNAFDLAIVDPPYGISVNVNMGRRKGNTKSSYHKYAGEDKKAPDRSCFEELQRVSEYQIIFGANHFIENIPNANSKSWIVWDKMFSNDVSFASAELAWTNIEKVVSVFKYSPNSPNRIHPTQKPVALYKWLLKNYAHPGDKILDTHIGSGSIRIACHDMGFDLVGCELDKDYFDAQEARYQNHISQADLFGTDEMQGLIFSGADNVVQ